MNRDETIVIMGILKTAYPRYYTGMKRTEAESAISLWTEMFSDDPAEIVAAAVKSFVATDEKGFPPHIGAIKSHVVKMQAGPQKSELEAWGDVKRALRNSGYNADREFDRLDPVIQRIVGAPSQLREWALAEIDTLDTVVSSNFQRSYRAISKEYREYLASPGIVRELLNETKHMGLTAAEPEPEQKSLPISVDATINQLKAEIAPNLGMFEAQKMETPLTPEEFEKKRQELLKSLEVDT